VLVAAVLGSLVVVAPVAFAGEGPRFVRPASGATLTPGELLEFEVAPVPGATDYLWGFFQDGAAVWENYANERVLSGPTYRIDPGTPAAEAIRPGALEVWVRGNVAGAWTEATILNVTVAPSAGAAKCRTIRFYGLRGSGEPAYKGEEGMGTLVFDTYAQFVSRANYAGVTVTADGVDGYPAVPFFDLMNDDLIEQRALKGAFESVQKGATSLGGLVESRRAANPAECFIFAGYSQGAWVIGEYLSSASGQELVKSDRIAGVVLYADPLFDPSFAESIGDDYLGVARQLKYFTGGDVPYIQSGIKEKVRSYCLSEDVVCNFRWKSLQAAYEILSGIPGGPPGSLQEAVRAMPNLFCLSKSDPTRVFCPHFDYRHSVSHLPVSDDGAIFLAQTALGLP
jgi:hypothetical protein